MNFRLISLWWKCDAIGSQPHRTKRGRSQNRKAAPRIAVRRRVAPPPKPSGQFPPCSMEHECVIDKLRSSEALCVHHHLMRINALT